MLDGAKQQWAWTSVLALGLLLTAPMARAQCWGGQAKSQGYANAALLASAQEVDDYLDNRAVVLLDTRSPVEWAGDSSLPVTR